MSIKDPNRVNEILESPWILWTISLAMACSLWLYINRTEGADYITQKFSAPLEYRTSDPQVRFLNRIPSVDVEVRGLEWKLMHFDTKSVRFYVDTQSVPVGMGVSSPREVRCEGLPEGVFVISRVPSMVDVIPVRENSNRMPVNFVLPEDIPQGLYVSKVEVSPREVVVRGTGRDLTKINGLQVRPTLAELQSGKEVTLKVQVLQSTEFEEGGVTIEPDTVNLKGTLARGLPKKNVPVNVRRIGKPDEDYEIVDPVVNPIEVQIEGKEDLLAKVTEVDTETVDVSMLKTDLDVIVPLKEPTVKGVSLTDVKSVQLTFHLSEIKAGKELTNVPVMPKNSEMEAATWTMEPSSVAVTLEGLPSKIRHLSVENAGVQAFVDLSNVFLDTLSLPVSVDIVSRDFRITKVEPAIVTVTMNSNNGRRTREIEAHDEAMLEQILDTILHEEQESAWEKEDGGE